MLGLLLGLLHYHWQIITAPVPLDLYEGTMPLITGLIADGHNPYTRAFQPQAADVYPPLYNIIVAPLSWVFGNTFALHRTVSGVFILIATIICGLASRRASGSRQMGVATGIMLYAALLFYATPVSSTNATGVAVFLAAVLVPWHYRFSTTSLLFGLVCGLLAYYSKQYFILCIPLLCLYTFLYISMSRALLLGALYTLCLLTSIVIVHSTSPYFLDNTLFAPSVAIKGLQIWDILLLQLRVFAATYSGIIAVTVIPACAAVFGLGFTHVRTQIVQKFQLARAGLHGPLLAIKGDYFWFCLFWSTLVIIFSLGQNPGNYMTYLFQLMSPFLLIIGFRALGNLTPKMKAIAPVVLISFYQAYVILPKDFSTNLDNWRKMETLIAEADQILASQMLVMTLLQQGKEVHQDGHTFYFPLASKKPDIFVKEKEEDRVSSIWRGYIGEMYRKIEQREYDLILVSPWEMRGIFLRNPPPNSTIGGKQYLGRFYTIDDRIDLSMTDRQGGGTYKIQVWRPKPESS